MKKLLLLIVFVFKFIGTYSQELNGEQVKMVKDFINCIKYKNIERLATKVSFPLSRTYPVPSIKNKQEFIARYKEIFDEKLSKLIADSDPRRDWSTVGWRGIMLSDGEIWLDYDGNLIAVNYESPTEVRRKAEFINLDRKRLHTSIQAFSEPVLIMETARFRIRIDDMGGQNYRYAAWKIGKKASEKPDLILYNGEYIPEGSIGNHSYEFKNMEYTYRCSVIIGGEEDSPPAALTIYKGEDEILYQRARLINQ